MLKRINENKYCSKRAPNLFLYHFTLLSPKSYYWFVAAIFETETGDLLGHYIPDHKINLAHYCYEYERCYSGLLSFLRADLIHQLEQLRKRYLVEQIWCGESNEA